MFCNTPKLDTILRRCQRILSKEGEELVLAGLSECGESGYNFYQLYLQAAISDATRMYRSADDVIPYRKQARGEAIRYMHRLAAGWELTEKDKYFEVISYLVEEAAQLQFDAAIDVYNQIVMNLNYRWPDKAKGLASRDIHEYLGAEVSYKEFFTPIQEFLEEAEIHVNDTQIALIIRYIEKHCTEELHLKNLAQRFHLTENYLSWYIKQHTDQTFTELLSAKRIALAQNLLRQTVLPIQEIAERVGYTEYSSFSRLFKKKTGYTLTDYRKNSKEEGKTGGIYENH